MSTAESQIVIQDQPPEGMALHTVTERVINAAGPGPYYVYMPGISGTGLFELTHAFSQIPAGQVFRISGIEIWSQLSQIPEGMARRERIYKNLFGQTTDRQGSIMIPAQVTVDSLFADKSLASHNLTRILPFDEVDDLQEDVFNKMIHPLWIEPMTYPKDWKPTLESIGMLKLRRRWLEEAAEALETGRVLEDYRKVIDRKPYLREKWLDAIGRVLIPANDAFEMNANSILAEKEEAMRGGRKATYDHYDHEVMWLLGRKPERTALSRTLEQAGKSGITAEDVATIVATVMAATGAQSATAATTGANRPTMPCPDCGEDVKMINGGPPRICRFCTYEFRAEDRPQELTAESIVETIIQAEPATPTDTARMLAESILKQGN